MCRVAGLPDARLCLRACSVSRSLGARLPKQSADGLILSAFRRACIVQYGCDDLLAVVAPELGNGPLNAVIERIPDEWIDLQAGMPAWVQGGLLRIGGLEVLLDSAETWEPCPDWERLRASREALLGWLEPMLDLVRARSMGGSLLALGQDLRPVQSLGESGVQARARLAAKAMWAGWLGDEGQLSAGASQLAGLGSGLTPAGDDFLLGTMFCAWLAHPNPKRYCELIASVASPKTTMLSRAFLRSAAAGQFGAPWHGLLLALEDDGGERLGIATREVLAYGHSSGADALAGFLWIGLRARELLKSQQAL